MIIESKIKKIDVWQDEEEDWIKYTLEELNEYFNFVTKPNFNNVREIYLRNAGFNTWMEIIFKNGSTGIYRKVYGTYIEQ